MSDEAELSRIRAAYERYEQDARSLAQREPDNPGLRLSMAEWHGAIADGLARRGLLRDSTRVLDVGCGGGWLLRFLADHGLSEERLAGVDLVPSRVREARTRVPLASIEEGNAAALAHPDSAYDAVCLGMVLSSILDEAMRARVASECMRVARPGGAVICYDVRLPNPLNPDVRRVSRADLAHLFVGAPMEIRTVSVLQPLTRRLGRAAPRLYPRLAAIPALRSCLLAFIEAGGGT